MSETHSSPQASGRSPSSPHLRVVRPGGFDGEPMNGSAAVDLISELQALLRAYPQVRYAASTDRVTIYPLNPDGFEIGLVLAGRGATVTFEGWHQAFTEAADALAVIRLGLSQAARLEVHFRGTVPYRWTVQADRSGTWLNVSTVSRLLYPFWRSKTIRYLQNRVLKAA